MRYLFLSFVKVLRVPLLDAQQYGYHELASGPVADLVRGEYLRVYPLLELAHLVLHVFRHVTPVSVPQDAAVAHGACLFCQLDILVFGRRRVSLALFSGFAVFPYEYVFLTDPWTLDLRLFEVFHAFLVHHHSALAPEHE